MKFGTKVWLTRGGSAAPGTPGCTRRVRGVLIGALDAQVDVRLTEDDPLATLGYCTQAGDVGCWGQSCITERVEDRP